MAAKIADLVEAMDFGGDGDMQAWVCVATGEMHFHSDLVGDDENFELPDDIEDETQYLAIPDRREMGLGRRVALGFASEAMNERDFADVREFFSHRGAYKRFRSLIERRGLLQRWYDFQKQADEAAMREWAEDDGISLDD
jgi:hypothetical protein